MFCNWFGALNCFGRRDDPANQPHEQVVATKKFSFNSLRSATKDFHPSSKIGGGGYGVVHKGVLRDGTQVAIKSLSVESKQGTYEFMTEIDIISNIRHPNLVELIGCCIEDSHRILVYEFMENNSLASSLLGSKSKYVSLDWPKRAAICRGTASGLCFLHEETQPNIVHRDIKASNILLDGNFNPKIGDFGLAKLFPDNVTHVSTRVAGTVGYLAPEYALLGQLTKKADVYSFGILMATDEEVVAAAPAPVVEAGLKHKLERKWTFWCDNQSKPKQGAAWGTSLRKVYTFDTVEEFWCLYDQIFKPSKLQNNADFHLFKTGVEPKWEDPECANGGKWTVTSNIGRKANLDNMWLETLMALIGEQFEDAEDICGVVASVRQWQDKLSLWTKTAANEAAQMSIGRKWKEIIDVNDKITYNFHDDSRTKGATKGRYTV